MTQAIIKDDDPILSYEDLQAHFEEKHREERERAAEKQRLRDEQRERARDIRVAIHKVCKPKAKRVDPPPKAHLSRAEVVESLGTNATRLRRFIKATGYPVPKPFPRHKIVPLRRAFDKWDRGIKIPQDAIRAANGLAPIGPPLGPRRPVTPATE